MKTVLVSGASGIVGYGILRSLRQSGHGFRLIGTSIHAASAAPGFSDVFELAPPTLDPGYMDWLLATIARQHVDLVIPGIEADLYKWVDHGSEIEAAGAIPLLNNRDLIETCRDKWSFYQRLETAGIGCAIETSLEADYETLEQRFGLPFIVKPRRGFGSKGVRLIDGREAFEQCGTEVGGRLMAQRFVGSDDEEYTVAAFGDGEGGFRSGMAMRRRLSREGFTELAEVVSIEPFREALDELCRLFHPVGPTNFQFRRGAAGVSLLEINPRISSSTSIRTAFGYNECAMAADYYLFGRMPDIPHIRGGKAVRYTEELVFYDDSLHF